MKPGASSLGSASLKSGLASSSLSGTNSLKKASSIKTGDEMPDIWLCIAGMIAALLAGGGIIYTRKRRKVTGDKI